MYMVITKPSQRQEGSQRTSETQAISSVQSYKQNSFFKINVFIFFYLFLAVLGLCCCTWAFSSCGEQGLLFVAAHGLLTVVASLVAEHGLQARSSCGTWAQWLWRTGLIAPWHVGSSRTRAQTHVPCIGRRILNHCATREAPKQNSYNQTSLKDS